ncbi:hypothetical protein KR215_005396 [Drosophila sulfurigaster]|uniref:uncharacterized protein LOC133846264 n=1 Tax=Drosophila sulfurigaster albostrigata TaxID=89887 RepID=UPI002D218B79|nr:uncharacterized protein LOC133846264 [Drosophila sulfurigaster albostrigata]KAH8391061.1 hypothetical protein KR215_005396 [Drosophila sulfurigaster]
MKSSIAIAVLIVGVVGVSVQAASVAKPTCGGTTSSKDINLVIPTNPPRECEYHINAYSKYVCQLRIDFAMTLAQPTLHEQSGGLKTAECDQDYFEVNGLRLCGVEVWQHIYVPFNATAGVSRIDLLIALANRAGGVSLPTPDWNMVVSQLECPAGASVRELEIEQRATSYTDGFQVAPPGCLQYFPDAKGVVKSFNYNEGAGIYPSHLNYAICFRRDTSTTALTIRSYFFHVGATSEATTLLTDSSCYRSGSSSVQNADFLMVPQATLVANNERATYFCGATSGDVVITSDNPGPLIVLFNSDGIYEPHDEGFAFTYTVQ